MSTTPRRRVAYLGPPGTFTEEALLSDPNLSSQELVPMGSFSEVLGTSAGDPETTGFVPIENSIEGSVNATLDSLVFDYDLLIQQEVVLDVHLHLIVQPGTKLENVRKVLSYPVALAQCRKFLDSKLPQAETLATKSTAEAAQILGDSPKGSNIAAVAPELSAHLYGLEVAAAEIEDHPGNQTRFVSLRSSGIPAPTGHDRTSIVCFQRNDQPGSLLAILEQFAARSINLTRLESRPTKKGLGQYCFVLDLDGHVQDEVVADCLRNLHAELPKVKFLGSYPAAGKGGPQRRKKAEAAWLEASKWVDSLRSQTFDRKNQAFDRPESSDKRSGPG